MAKAAHWRATDPQGRKRGEQTGLDTLVVHAVNGAHSMWADSDPARVQANALSAPPGDYDRKVKTQRN